MKLIRKSLKVKGIRTDTTNKRLAVKLLNKGFSYRYICGIFISLEKKF